MHEIECKDVCRVSVAMSCTRFSSQTKSGWTVWTCWFGVVARENATTKIHLSWKHQH